METLFFVKMPCFHVLYSDLHKINATGQPQKSLNGVWCKEPTV